MCHKSKTNTREKGKKGEDKATDYLIENGFEIVRRNYYIRGGEIDIIAKDKDILVFVEVKRLPSGNHEILQHELGLAKQKRIIKTAKSFLSNNRQYNDTLIRFDVIVVDMPGQNNIWHIKSAFMETV